MDNTESRKLEVILTEETILEYGKEQAKELLEVTKLEVEKAALQAKIKPKKERIAELASAIDCGKEIQDVGCEWEYLWEKRKKVLRRKDTYEPVERVEIKDWELQQHFDMPGTRLEIVK